MSAARGFAADPFQGRAGAGTELPGGEGYILAPLPHDGDASPDSISFIIADAGEADSREAAERDFTQSPTYFTWHGDAEKSAG